MVGRGDQHLNRPLGLRLRSEQAGELIRTEFVEQTVAAQQQPVARGGDQLPGINGDVGLDAEGAGDHVALRVGRRLVLGEATLAHEGLDQAVVLGDLTEPVGVGQVDP